MEFTHTFWLPFPPSVNRIWRYARGKAYAAPEYVRWKKQADAAGQTQKLGTRPVIGRNIIEVKLSDAFMRRRDGDNRLKPVLDWCERFHLIVNDRYTIKSSIEWDATVEHDCVVTLSGVVEFASQWDFAQWQAKTPARRRRA